MYAVPLPCVDYQCKSSVAVLVADASFLVARPFGPRRRPVREQDLVCYIISSIVFVIVVGYDRIAFLFAFCRYCVALVVMVMPSATCRLVSNVSCTRLCISLFCRRRAAGLPSEHPDQGASKKNKKKKDKGAAEADSPEDVERDQLDTDRLTPLAAQALNAVQIACPPICETCINECKRVQVMN